MLAPALRKAAILISALDRDSADALLDQMPEAQAAQVRNAVMELPDVSREEQEAVLREFFHGNRPAHSEPHSTIPSTMPSPSGGARADDPGVELQLAQHAVPPHLEVNAQTGSLPSLHGASPKESTPPESPQPAGPSIAPSVEQPVAEDAAPLFEHLEKATAETLAKLLRTEHPQVTAVVLSHLAPEKAAAIIESFEDQMQVDVLHRVAAISDADPDSIRQLDRELSASLKKLDPAMRLSDSGVQAVEAILNATQKRQDIVQRLQQHKSPLTPRVAEAAFDGPNSDRLAARHPSTSSTPVRQSPALPPSISPPSTSYIDTVRRDEQDHHAEWQHTPIAPVETGLRTTQPRVPEWTFADVTQLPDADLAILLKAASPQVVLLSLLGAEARFVNRLMQQLPPADAKRFRQRIHQTAPLALADIDEAQRRLALLAAELMAQGRIQKQRTQFAAAA